MKSTFVELADNDKKAKEFILESLSICAHNHILSRKLLNRFSTATGRMFAIIGDWFDLDQMTAYDYSIVAPEGEYALGDRPTERLVAFVSDYLQTTDGGIVVCENWAADRRDLANWPWPPPRVACYGDDEVYHIVTPDISDPELIEAAVAARHHWQTNVCSSCAHVQEGDIPNEAFLDEIVENTRHILMPAFDGSGYLVWSPKPSA